MHTEYFSGLLERIDHEDSSLVLRFVTGDLDPEPREPPVLIVKIDGASDLDLPLGWGQLLGAYVSVALTGCDVHLNFEDEGFTTITGNTVTHSRGEYEAEDFKRLARQNYAASQRYFSESRAHYARLGLVRDVINAQRLRIVAKAERYEVGSTASVLYDQHLRFLDNLLQEIQG